MKLEINEGLSFDDVLLIPGYTDIAQLRQATENIRQGFDSGTSYTEIRKSYKLGKGFRQGTGEVRFITYLQIDQPFSKISQGLRKLTF